MIRRLALAFWNTVTLSIFFVVYVILGLATFLFGVQPIWSVIHGLFFVCCAVLILVGGRESRSTLILLGLLAGHIAFVSIFRESGLASTLLSLSSTLFLPVSFAVASFGFQPALFKDRLLGGTATAILLLLPSLALVQVFFGIVQRSGYLVPDGSLAWDAVVGTMYFRDAPEAFYILLFWLATILTRAESLRFIALPVAVVSTYAWLASIQSGPVFISISVTIWILMSAITRDRTLANKLSRVLFAIILLAVGIAWTLLAEWYPGQASSTPSSTLSAERWAAEFFVYDTPPEVDAGLASPCASLLYRVPFTYVRYVEESGASSVVFGFGAGTTFSHTARDKQQSRVSFGEFDDVFAGKNDVRMACAGTTSHVLAPHSTAAGVLGDFGIVGLLLFVAPMFRSLAQLGRPGLPFVALVILILTFTTLFEQGVLSVVAAVAFLHARIQLLCADFD